MKTAVTCLVFSFDGTHSGLILPLSFSQIFLVDQVCVSSDICCLSHGHYVSQTKCHNTVAGVTRSVVDLGG